MLNVEQLLSRFDPQTGEIAGVPAVERHLSDLRGCFADAAAYEQALAVDNPLVYTVASVALAGGAGDLNYAVGRLMPGCIGNEFYLTKGHFHAWRDAAEIYLGLSGDGLMLLEDEMTGESRVVPLRPHHVAYVPGHTAHRTVNVGPEPLIYIGVYPARAGHDYDAIARTNFRHLVVEHDGQPVLIPKQGKV